MQGGLFNIINQKYTIDITINCLLHVLIVLRWYLLYLKVWKQKPSTQTLRNTIISIYESSRYSFQKANLSDFPDLIRIFLVIIFPAY